VGYTNSLVKEEGSKEKLANLVLTCDKSEIDKRTGTLKEPSTPATSVRRQREGRCL
jgi:hypothetical protein